MKTKKMNYMKYLNFFRKEEKDFDRLFLVKVGGLIVDLPEEQDTEEFSLIGESISNGMNRILQKVNSACVPGIVYQAVKPDIAENINSSDIDNDSSLISGGRVFVKTDMVINPTKDGVERCGIFQNLTPDEIQRRVEQVETLQGVK
jgi:hypothetical protein